MKDFLEQRIIEAIKKLLTGQVNVLLGDSQFSIPVIEFGGNGCGYTVAPVISLRGCERTEKERIVRQDVYSLTITISFPESPESELHCYAYAGAVGRAIYDNPTLGGVVDRAVITSKIFKFPKKPNCREDSELVITLRITVEGIKK